MNAVAWSEVAKRLQPVIARNVAPSDIDDVMQDVLLRIHRGLGELRDDDRFAGWIYRIARTAIAEHGRARGRHPIAEPSDAVEVNADFDGDDGDRAPSQALASCLMPFVARLASPYREAVTLVELEGMAARGAAEATRISLSAMKSRVQRGRAQLREMLNACCEIAVDARGKVTDFTPRSSPPCCSPPRR